MVEQGQSGRSTYTNPRCWESLLTTMKQALPCLEHFHMSNSYFFENESRPSAHWSRKVSSRMIQQFMFDEGMNPFTGIHDNDGIIETIGLL